MVGVRRKSLVLQVEVRSGTKEPNREKICCYETMEEAKGHTYL
jgi:hypothetical protein